MIAMIISKLLSRPGCTSLYPRLHLFACSGSEYPAVIESLADAVLQRSGTTADDDERESRTKEGKRMIGYKMVHADGTSLSRHLIKYPLDGTWVEVPGNGAYVAINGGLEHNRGPLLVKVECEEPTGAEAPDGVQCFRRIRILGVVQYAEWPDGAREYYSNGWLHREDGPAIEKPNGHRVWYRNGWLHRDDGPAIEEPSGFRAWFRNGQLHRDDGPAIIAADGTQEWYRDGVRQEPPTDITEGKS